MAERRWALSSVRKVAESMRDDDTLAYVERRFAREVIDLVDETSYLRDVDDALAYVRAAELGLREVCDG